MSVLALALVVSAAGCSDSSTPAYDLGRSTTGPATAAARVTSPTAKIPSPTDPNGPVVTACYARNKAVEPYLLVREKIPNQPYTVRAFGGGYVYNYAADACQDFVTFHFALLTDEAGFCEQIATAAANRGYNIKTKPAQPLSEVIASKGTC